MNPYVDLFYDLSCLRRLIDLLTPNFSETDANRIENNIEDCIKLYDQVSGDKLINKIKCIRKLPYTRNLKVSIGFTYSIIDFVSAATYAWQITYKEDYFINAEHLPTFYKSERLNKLVKEVDELLLKTRKEVVDSCAKFVELHSTYLLKKDAGLYKKHAKGLNIPPTNKKIEKFSDAFIINDWEEYIQVFQKCTPKLINENMEFIGKNRGHKGVICSWFYTLQARGLIFTYLTRQQLAAIINSEIKNIAIGADGKSFNLTSSLYESSFKHQFFELCGMEEHPRKRPR